MKSWMGRSGDGVFGVELHASMLSTLDRYCREAASLETGGILVGRYSNDRSLAVVGEATPPPSDSRRGRSWFVRGVNGLRDMLHKRWSAKDRTHYVGEWHYHPTDHVEPSDDDIAQMIEISLAKKYDCKEPLLLILGARNLRGQRLFRIFVCPGDGPPVELVPKDSGAL